MLALIAGTAQKTGRHAADPGELRLNKRAPFQLRNGTLWDGSVPRSLFATTAALVATEEIIQ